MTEADIEQSPSAPAGWYPDPAQAETQRYWDGERWTDQLAPIAPPAKGASVSFTPRLFLGLAGSIAVVVATFLPQADSPAVLQISSNTLMQNGDGVLFVILAIGAAAAIFRNSGRPGRSVAMIFFGVLIMALAYYDGTGDRIAVVNGFGAEVEASVGIGIWMAGIGGFLIAIAGLALAGPESVAPANTENQTPGA